VCDFVCLPIFTYQKKKKEKKREREIVCDFWLLIFKSNIGDSANSSNQRVHY
jgi:hypothetical protein